MIWLLGSIISLYTSKLLDSKAFLISIRHYFHGIHILLASFWWIGWYSYEVLCDTGNVAVTRVWRLHLLSLVCKRRIRTACKIDCKNIVSMEQRHKICSPRWRLSLASAAQINGGLISLFNSSVLFEQNECLPVVCFLRSCNTIQSSNKLQAQGNIGSKNVF